MNKLLKRSLVLAAAALAATPPIAAQTGKIVPPQIIQTVPAHFPISLEDSTIPDGDVTVLLTISADGRLTDALVLSYTHRDFAQEALSALHAWSYKAATKDGQPIGVRVALKMHFSTTARAVSLYPIDTLAALIRKPAQAYTRDLLADAADLDKPLTVVSSTEPKLTSPPAHGPNGTTTVEFYVDTEGRPRVPVVLHSTDPAFAEAAVRALGDWKFAVPTRDGEPVIVRTRQEFVFKNGS